MFYIIEIIFLLQDLISQYYMVCVVMVMPHDMSWKSTVTMMYLKLKL